MFPALYYNSALLRRTLVRSELYSAMAAKLNA